MANNSTIVPDIGMNGTENNQDDGIGCGPPPGWTGVPPPGVYANTADLLQKIVLPIIILFGTFGNLTTIAVLIRQSKKLSTTGLFLLCLALSDTLLLYNAPLRRWIKSVWDFDVRHHGIMGCKLSVYFTYCSIQFSSWILVAVTIERLICVVWPHRVKLGCTKRNSGIFIATVFVIIFGFNTHILYGFGRSLLDVHAGQGYCEPQYEDYLTFWTKIYSFIDFTVSFLLPFIVLVVSNSLIIHRLSLARRERNNMAVLKDMNKFSTLRDSDSVTIMLVTLGIVFFFCMAPVSVYFIYSPYWSEHNKTWICINVYEYLRLEEIQYLVFAVVTILGDANASLNFLLYVVSGSKFRSQIKALFVCQSTRNESVFGTNKLIKGGQRFTAYSELSSTERASSVPRWSAESRISVGVHSDHSEENEGNTDAIRKNHDAKF